MSQFCGSFWALARRSRLTVIEYCPLNVTTAAATRETAPRAARIDISLE
jgi:hypothetical protein